MLDEITKSMKITGNKKNISSDRKSPYDASILVWKQIDLPPVRKIISMWIPFFKINLPCSL